MFLTFYYRAVKRSHDVKAKKTESICSNPDDVEQKVGKKRGRKKKEKITKFVDDMEVVEQQVLNGNKDARLWLLYQSVCQETHRLISFC